MLEKCLPQKAVCEMIFGNTICLGHESLWISVNIVDGCTAILEIRLFLFRRLIICLFLVSEELPHWFRLEMC